MNLSWDIKLYKCAIAAQKQKFIKSLKLHPVAAHGYLASIPIMLHFFLMKDSEKLTMS